MNQTFALLTAWLLAPLAVFNRALSAEEMATLSAINRARPGDARDLQ